jgi:putative ABC transport system ATP-binding protein
MNTAVHCRDLEKEFGSGQARVLALRGVDFDVRFGETTFLVGPSGCGKTTLLSVVAGLLDSPAARLSSSGKTSNASGRSSASFFVGKTLGSFSSNTICCPRSPPPRTRRFRSLPPA